MTQNSPNMEATRYNECIADWVRASIPFLLCSTSAVKKQALHDALAVVAERNDIGFIAVHVPDDGTRPAQPVVHTVEEGYGIALQRVWTALGAGKDHGLLARFIITVENGQCGEVQQHTDSNGRPVSVGTLDTAFVVIVDTWTGGIVSCTSTGVRIPHEFVDAYLQEPPTATDWTLGRAAAARYGVKHDDWVGADQVKAAYKSMGQEPPYTSRAQQIMDALTRALRILLSNLTHDASDTTTVARLHSRVSEWVHAGAVRLPVRVVSDDTAAAADYAAALGTTAVSLADANGMPAHDGACTVLVVKAPLSEEAVGIARANKAAKDVCALAQTLQASAVAVVGRVRTPLRTGLWCDTHVPCLALGH